MTAQFTWNDGERVVRFGRGVVAEAPDLLAARGFERYALLTTERAAEVSPALVASAETVLHVPSGPVPDVAAAVRAGVRGHPVVALGGGRVVDAAKAVAAADGLGCAAIPTTLAGSPMTPFHRMPAGVEATHLVRPRLVVWDPDLAESLPRPQLVATAMNALAHAFESLYTPLANPVAELAALSTAELLARELPRTEPDRAAVALGALLGGYAVGLTGFAVHHALCQTTVRVGSIRCTSQRVYTCRTPSSRAERINSAFPVTGSGASFDMPCPNVSTAIPAIASMSPRARTPSIGRSMPGKKWPIRLANTA